MQKTDPTFDSLIERLIDQPDANYLTIPIEWRERKELQQVFLLMRVFGQMQHNIHNDLTEFDTNPAPSQQTFGAYRLIRLLGTGGMGEVWLASRADGAAEYSVAIKRVRGHLGTFADRLHKERQILAKLTHPNIARFVDAGLDDQDLPWFAMDFVDGISITSWCEQNRASLRARLELFIKVCSAVAHAHRHLIVHRDIKPSNVLVDRDGEPKLLDFGIAKLLDEARAENTLEILTLSYASPEQIRGEEISTNSDIYSLGLLLFRLLSGGLPNTRNNKTNASISLQLDKEESQRPSRLQDFDATLPYSHALLKGDLDAIVAKAMRTKPEARYGTVAEFAIDVQNYLDARPVQAREPTLWYRFSRFLDRNRVVAVLYTVILASLLIGAWSSWRQAQAATREASRADQISNFLTSLFREQDPLSRAGDTVRDPKVMISDAVSRVKEAMPNDAEGRVKLFLTLAEAQMNLGDLLESKNTLKQARASLREQTNSNLKARLITNEGEISMREGDDDQAILKFEQALKLLQNDPLGSARVQVRYAASLNKISKLEPALKMVETAHFNLKDQLGPQHFETLAALAAIGNIQVEMRDDVRAQIVLKELIRRLEQKTGENNARLIHPLVNLAESDRHLSQPDSARHHLQRALSIAQSQLGPKSERITEVAVRLALLERQVNNLEESNRYLEIGEAALPPGFTGHRASLAYEHGMNDASAGNHTNAEKNLRLAVSLRKNESAQLKSGLAWFTQARLGWVVAHLNRFDEANQLLEEAAVELRKILGPNAYQNAMIAADRVDALMLQGRHAEALIQIDEAQRLTEIKYGRSDERFLRMASNRAIALSNLPGRKLEAIKLFDNLIQNWLNKKVWNDSYLQAVNLRCELTPQASLPLNTQRAVQEWVTQLTIKPQPKIDLTQLEKCAGR